MRQGLPLLILLGANLLWGASFVVSKSALEQLTPLQLSAGRMILAGLIVLPWLLREQVRGALPLRAWPILALLGVLAFGASKFLGYWGLSLTSATDASLLISVEPLFTIALGWLLLREALTRRRIAAFALGAAGAWLLIARGLRLPELSAAHVVGDLVFLLGLVAEAVCSVLGKRQLRRHSALLVTAAMIVASLGLWLPIAVGETLRGGWPALSLATAGAIVYVALGCTVLAYWAWFRALAHLEAGLVALSLFVQPVWGAALSIWLLGEPLRPATLAGGALVLASLYLALRPAVRGKPAPRQ
jgi:drug/metabolite transporter (DMT)-like permease